jgi:hypothetical protein
MVVSKKGFFRGSFMPFFPWNQGREESVNSRDKFRESTFIVNELIVIL